MLRGSLVVAPVLFVVGLCTPVATRAQSVEAGAETVAASEPVTEPEAETGPERRSEEPTQSAVLAGSRSDPRRPENPVAEPETAAAPEAVEYVPAPPPPRTREEVEEEEERALEEEPPLPPPPEPEWRLRAGAGIAIPLNGASQPLLRLSQDLEWHPLDLAPFFFGVGGAEYLVPATLGAANARVGGAAYFCEDSVVRCQGAVALVVGALIGQSLVAFDVGGEADARFLFGPLELFVRVGFGGGGGYNFVYGNAGLGAAF